MVTTRICQSINKYFVFSCNFYFDFYFILFYLKYNMVSTCSVQIKDNHSAASFIYFYYKYLYTLCWWRIDDATVNSKMAILLSPHQGTWSWLPPYQNGKSESTFIFRDDWSEVIMGDYFKLINNYMYNKNKYNRLSSTTITSLITHINIT